MRGLAAIALCSALVVSCAGPGPEDAFEGEVSVEEETLPAGVTCAEGATCSGAGEVSTASLRIGKGPGSEGRLAQTFVAGPGAWVREARLRLQRLRPLPAGQDTTVTVEVRPAPGGVPGTSSVARATALYSALDGAMTFVLAPIDPEAPIAVVPGDPYALVISVSAPSGGATALVGVGSHLGNPYPGGEAMRQAVRSGVASAFTRAGVDLSFSISSGSEPLCPEGHAFSGGACVLTGGEPVWVTPAALGSFLQGDHVEVALAATHPVGAPLTFSVVGSLPPSFTLTPDGVLSGSLLALGAASFTVRVSDGPHPVDRTFTASVGARTTAFVDDVNAVGDDCLTVATACRPETLQAKPFFALDLAIVVVGDVTLTQTFTLLGGQVVSGYGSMKQVTVGAFVGFQALPGNEFTNLRIHMTATGGHRAIDMNLPAAVDNRGHATLAVRRVTIDAIDRNVGVDVQKLGITSGNLSLILDRVTYTGGERGLFLNVSHSTEARLGGSVVVTKSTFRDFAPTSASPDAISASLRGGWDAKLRLEDSLIDGTTTPSTLHVAGVTFTASAFGTSPPPWPELDVAIRRTTIRNTSEAIALSHEDGGRARIEIVDNPIIESRYLNAIVVNTAGGDVRIEDNGLISSAAKPIVLSTETNGAGASAHRIRVAGNVLEHNENDLLDGVQLNTSVGPEHQVTIVNNEFRSIYDDVSIGDDTVCADVSGNVTTGTRLEFRTGFREATSGTLGNVRVRQAAMVVATNAFGTVLGLSGNLPTLPGLPILLENSNDLDFGAVPIYVEFGSSCAIDPLVPPAF